MNNKIKKILIIGSQGYLGSSLTDYLQERGYYCVGVDIGFFQYGVLHSPKKVPVIDKEARTITEEDINKFDVVLMLAGISNDPFGNLSYEEVYDPTRDYAIKVAKMCKKLGVRYIFPSSCSVYGDGGDGSQLDESAPTNPLTPYAVNKLQIEQDLTKLADKTFSPIALRFGTVFGVSPRVRFDVVINMLCGMAVAEKKVILNSDGQAWRPHIYIDDVCESFRCSIDWDYSQGELMIFNVGRNDANFKIIDIAKIIQLEVDGCELQLLSQSSIDDLDDLVKDRKVQDGVDKRTYRVCFDKIHETLPGFEASWTVEKGIKRLVQDLVRWKLNQTKFKQREFYRLQHLEHLYKTGQIDEKLTWN
jgi:nucleoside-diphosphate-sugar epimerase